MTPRICASLAAQLSLPLYGLKDGSTCMGGTDADLAMMYGPGLNCTSPCSGDPSLDCGGINQTSLYRFTLEPPGYEGPLFPDAPPEPSSEVITIGGGDEGGVAVVTPVEVATGVMTGGDGSGGVVVVTPVTVSTDAGYDDSSSLNSTESYGGFSL